MVDRKEEKRHRILRSAIAVFAQKGFYHAKISEIAQQAGVADGTIYLYFKNKDHLLIAIFEDEMERIIDRFTQELAAEPTPPEKLRRFIRLHAELVTSDPDLTHVLQVELRQSSMFMSDYKPQKFQEFLRILEKVVRDGQADGSFRQDFHPGVLKRSVFGALDELALNWILRGRRYDLHASAAALADLFLNGVLVAPETAEPATS